MPRRLLKPLHRNRDFLERAALALVLPFVAGLVNAEGFFIVGVYTSHVTGTVAHAGEAVARGQLTIALPALLLVAAFFVGAAAATALVAPAPAVGVASVKARYTRALGMEVLTLSTLTAIGLWAPARSRPLQLAATLLLSFSMGAQNALVSKLSGAVVRNTHLTGIVTDLGIESVRVWRWFWASLRAAQSLDSSATAKGQSTVDTSGLSSFARFTRLVAEMPRSPELRRLRLHGAIFGSFFAGAVIGPLMYLREGYVAMLLPILVLAALMVFDAGIGLRGKDTHSDEPSAETPAP